MARGNFSLSRLVALAGLTLSLVTGHPVQEARAIIPSADPFYQPPAGFESEEPGAILRTRPIIASFLGLIPDLVEAHQLLYRTTAVNGSAIATVTTVFKPLGAKTDRFVSFHTAYDSSATLCNPSYNYQLLAFQTDIISSAEFFILQAYLLSGYIVAAPDYEGPDAAFGPGRLEGMGVLDGIRAVKNFGKLKFTTENPSVVGVGYSGGGIATGWAASLHPTYAPELDVKGWVSGGTPANLTGTLLKIDGSLYSGFIAGSVAGLIKPSAYLKELSPLLDTILTKRGQEVLDFASKNCAVSDLLYFANKSIQDYDFQSLGPNLLSNSIVQSVLKKNTMGAVKEETPTAPVFLYHASQDEIIPYGDVSKLADTWCANGASVKFTTFAQGGHLTTEIAGVADALNFVNSAFNGTLDKGCSKTTELNSTLSPTALGPKLKPALSKIAKAGAILGDSDSNVKKNLSTLKTSV